MPNVNSTDVVNVVAALAAAFAGWSAWSIAKANAKSVDKFTDSTERTVALAISALERTADLMSQQMDGHFSGMDLLGKKMDTLAERQIDQALILERLDERTKKLERLV